MIWRRTPSVLYRFDANLGTLELVHEIDHPLAEAGPRSLALHPDGVHFYSVEEAGHSVTAYEFDANAEQIRPLQSLSLLPEGLTAHEGAQGGGLVVHPLGHSLYASIRSYDHIAHICLDDPGAMRLEDLVSAGGSFTRTLTLSPDARFLYSPNTLSNSVTSFHVDTRTGTLTRALAALTIPSPTHIAFNREAA